MAIPQLDSVKLIEHHYRTGEEPVLATCSDMNAYICKYMRTSLAAYKLVCELVGSSMASFWNFASPDIAFVNIKQGHWPIGLQHSVNATSLGSKKIEGVIDVNPSSICDIQSTDAVFQQLITIALFDFWIANEDRNANNANLLYDVINSRFISIDYGCILNTATFDYPLSQLTSTDSILYSDLFRHLSAGRDCSTVDLSGLKDTYLHNVERCKLNVNGILSVLPVEWNVPHQVVGNKLTQLFAPEWIAGVWDNFVEQLKDNISNG
ncbi:MAG: hypothetical protein K6E86_00220 [Bacteroidales bacterium]|nr:hypothetical protein [Bacteroidales bacterium]